MKKKALITGVTGQDGSYLAELLISKGYEVHGMVRRSSTLTRERIDHIHDEINLKLHYGELEDSSSIEKILQEVKPDEVYNLGAQSHVGVSFQNAVYALKVNGVGACRVIEAMSRITPEARFYQASSSELFGEVEETPQNEHTKFKPISPYAIGKRDAFDCTTLARRTYNMHASNGILFNHESPRRGENFVTRKITISLAKIKLGLHDKGRFSLGNLDAQRDWGYAKDYVEAMWLILQQPSPDDYVIGTGENHSVREFLETAADHIGLDIQSNGKQGVDEKYLDATGKTIVEIDPRFFRPVEVNTLLADPSKSKRVLGWEPKVKFQELVKIMADADLKAFSK